MLDDPQRALATHTDAVIEVDGVTIAYPTPAGEVVALRDLSLSIAPGEIVGLIGEAGCGKSTAALSLLGLVRPPGRVRSGRVIMNGRDLLRLSREELRLLRGREIGLIVQNSRAALNPLLTVGRQIETVYRAHTDASAADARRHAVEMLRSVGINDPERRVHAYPHEISGGMAQRVLIAIAMSVQPKLLVADEPTSGLDVTIQAQFLDQLWHTARRAGSATLLVTQDVGVIANYCDRILVMQQGAIVESRDVASFFRSPEHPYSRSILLMQQERSDAGRRASPTISGAPLLEVRGLTKRFPLRNSRKVVHAVSDAFFSIRAGETLGLVGESGSGKTTVGRCLLGLARPDDGGIWHHGKEIGSLAHGLPHHLRAKLQIVFQDPFDALDPRWTVAELLLEPLRLHTKLGRKEQLARVKELLELVGLAPGLAAVRPRGLSAGQQQRIGIARALACEPELIVLDEPTSALAPASRTATIQLLRSLQDRLGIAYLFISHDLATVRHLSHRVAVMYLSQVVEIGSRDEIFSHPRHPYTRALLAAHLNTDPSRRRPEHPPATRLVGEIPSPIDLPPGCFLAGRCPDEQPRCRTQRQHLIADPQGRLVRCWRATEPDPEYQPESLA